MTLALLLLSALALPASTMALSTTASDSEQEPLRRSDGPATPSIWEPPANPAPIPIRPLVPQQPPMERPLSANPLWAIPLATLSNTRERPIFSASRRPPPAAAAPIAVLTAPPPPKPAAIERPRLSLVGTITGDDQSFGIFVDLASRSALRLHLGEAYQGWRLQAVQGRQVTLERDRQTTILSLPTPGGETAAMPAPVQAENASLDDEADPMPPRRRR